MRTDIFGRAVPWSELILNHPGVFRDLNVGRAERAKAGVALGLLLCVAGTLSGLLPAWSVVGMLIVAGIANRELAAVFWRANGPLFMLGGLLFHQAYYLYGAAAYLGCAVKHAFGQGGAPRAAAAPDSSREPGSIERVAVRAPR